MTFLLLWGCVPCLALTAWVALARHRTWRTLGGRGHVALYLAVMATEQALAVAQVVALWALMALFDPLLARWLGIFAYTALIASAFADAAFFVESGIRLQVSLLSFRKALTEFADSRPWRRYVAALAAIKLVAASGAYVALTTRSLQPITPAQTLAGVAALFAVGIAVHALRAYLPLPFAFEWDSRLIATERDAFLDMWARAQEHEEDNQNTGPVPQALRGGNEASDDIDPAYPLLRHTRAFTGDKHFTVQCAPGEKPHVVLMFLESFRAHDVGVMGAPHPHSVTPCFDKLCAEGMLWNNFYANGTITSRAMTSAFYGVLPDFRAYSMQAASEPPPVTGMPQLFSQAGYRSVFFCDGPIDWENKRDFFLRHGFEALHGSSSIRALYPQAPQTEWCFPDEYLMRFHADWLADQDASNTPTFSSVLTVTNHMPWIVPEDAPIPDVGVDTESDYGRYLRTTMYTDRALGLYMDLLRQKGLDKKTVVFVLGDHGQQMTATGSMDFSGRYSDSSVRVPLLLWAPGRVRPGVIDEITSQIDLLPTMMDAFDLRGPQHGMGSSLLRKSSERTAFTIHPWSPGMLSNRVGPYRYVYSFDAHKAALYDLRHDPEEKRDISAMQPALVRAQTALAHAVRRDVDALHTERRFAPPSVAPPLMWPRLRALQDDFPKTLAQSAARARALVALVQTGKAKPDAIHEMNVHVVAMSNKDVDEASRLLYVQLMLARLHLLTMGELTRAEMQKLVELDAKLTAPEAPLPPWLRVTYAGTRRRANIPPPGAPAVAAIPPIPGREAASDATSTFPDRY